jgi:Fe-S cluster biogenesis protein NfuA
MDNSISIQDYIENNIRYKVQADGGEIRFVNFENDVLTLKLQGECSICGVSRGCLKDWLTKDVSHFVGHPIQINYMISKPYFWDR